ncbi:MULTISPECIES: hypothetical protein [Clostridium]|uniref:hypothetical protein n=1 Tax=Clostridium TaxID=1485 RepID=UPI0009097D61|nr:MULTISPECIES: hypothetical protein [Clostridium]APF25153.1 hypothetical protein NPD7_4077 [Clostridium sporogenes]MBD5639564.1 hypothetical protein [Clostridium botulinum]MDI6918928.1 hypothetical protein [Clostridium botulinum]WMU99550.1 hypothetical protein QA656_19670 [Clostridium botulinum]
MKVNKKSFKTINGLELVVINRRSAVIFEIGESHKEDKYDFLLKFSSEVFKNLLEHIEAISNKSWTNITPKECDSLGADYSEYYDRQFDNNGYMSISENTLSVERPCLESNKLYQFTKRKMESFIHDFRKAVLL